MTIRILPNSTINRIAAGEVIERPASVIKELVENSLDAGATEIEVIIEEAGKNLIIVQDNGKGMSKADLLLAIQRHATSKLPNDDILDIRYFGFRGEALPSIASISRMNIASKQINDEHGWNISLEGGEQIKISPATIRKGSRIEVRDLFYATPARLQFLKSDRTEIQQIQDIMKKFAMANPKVNFTLNNSGKIILSTSFSYNSSANSSDINAESAARICEILGKEFSENSMILSHQRENMTLSGFASLPTYHVGNSTMQYLFVNNRPVRDKLLLGVVRAAYQDVLSSDRYPIVVLFLNLPSNEVDVNVHPAKAEVRFRDAQSVRGLIIGALRNAINDAGFRAANHIATQSLKRFSSPDNNSSNLFNAPLFTNLNSNPANSNQTNSNQKFEFQTAELAFRETDSSAYSAYIATGVQTHILPPQARSFSITESENNSAISYPLGAAKTQLHKTYIVAETPEGMVIIDQHAAHERLVYEKMKRSLAENSIQRQRLLIPEVIEIEPAIAEKLLSYRQKFEQLGLVIEEFGHGSIIVRETPALLGVINVQSLINSLADDIKEYDETMSLEKLLGHVCGTMACHASIRAGRELDISEMNALLREMEQTPASGQCNHGRPTYITLKRKDIETLFGRR